MNSLTPESRREPGGAASRLEARKTAILEIWRSRVSTALAATQQSQPPVLLDHLPAFLAELSQSIECNVPRAFPETASIHATVADSTDASALSQEILELRLLRKTVLDVLEAEQPVRPEERQIILDKIDAAVQKTAARFLRSQQKARYWSEEQYRVIVENLHDHAIFMLDPEGAIISWNSAAEKMVQYRVDEIIGEHTSVIFTAEDRRRGAPEDELRVAAATGVAEDDRWHVRKDGSRFWASGILCSIRDGTGILCGYSKIIRDNTVAHMAARRQAIQHAITAILASARSLNEAAAGLLKSIGEIADWTFGALWMVDSAAGVLRCEEIWSAPSIISPEFARFTKQEAFARGVGLPGRCWENKCHVWVLNAAGEEKLPRMDAAAVSGLHAGFAFPILLDGQVLGVFEFFSEESRIPDTDFIKMMADLGSQVSQFIERRRAEQTRNRSEALKSGILQSSLDAIVTMDSHGRVVEFNPAAERIFGYTRENAIGKLLADLIVPPSLRENHARGLARYLETGRGDAIGRRLELTGMRSDGTEIPVELTITRIPGDGEPVFTGFLRDIRDRKELELQLRQRAEALVEADARKNEFLAMLAHELRNPLAPIINSVHLLRNCGSTDPAERRARDVVERQVEHMSLLIEDLLNITRVAHGKIRLRRKPIDLVELVKSTVGDHRMSLESEGLNIDLELPEEPLPVMGDRLRLAQVLGNLLSNAGKFTDPGGKVTVRVERSDDGQWAQVSVSDTGVGIDPETLPHLFETFVQGKQSLERSRGGLGLGLALVKGLVEMHGGTVSAGSSGVGAGAEFSFRLPLLFGGNSMPVPVEAAGPTRTGLRVLIVEDNSDAAETMGDLLEMFGHEVAIAYSGPEGVECARKFSPDVVLCDLGLPGMDGYAVAAELRRLPATANARLIALSGYGQEEDRRRSHEAGFDLHITKPVDPDGLERLLTES